eukprot:m.307501 g.307501  ORF g.307501 m.307501 type:complete len:522 (+) comp42362_c0_seq1:47-1612(+)
MTTLGLLLTATATLATLSSAMDDNPGAGPSSQELAAAITSRLHQQENFIGSSTPKVLTNSLVCGQALGLTTGVITDAQIKTSSDHNHDHDRRGVRLNTFTQPVQSWSALHNNKDQFVQVDFGKVTKVEGVATQGRANVEQWVTEYRIFCSADGTTWTPYREGGADKIFVGNSDQHRVIRNNFSPPISCRFIRLNPVTWFNHISLRLEFYGCLNACDSPLGTSTGALDNSRLSSSTDADANHDVRGSRLNTYWIGAKSWSAKANNVPQQWFQIDVGYVTTITAVATQSRGDHAHQQRVTKYRLDFSNDGQTWRSYRGSDGNVKVFTGNTDAKSVVKNRLSPSVKARYVRFRPLAFFLHVSMRAEVYGCPEACSFPLGMSTGAISSHQISVTSYAHPGCEGYSSRLNTYTSVGAWCVRINDQSQWIQINLGRRHRVTALSTQGRAFADQWVTGYSVSYSLDGTNWRFYKDNGGNDPKIFIGNADKEAIVKHGLFGVTAHYVRVHPRTWLGHASMRLELYGCLG